MLVFLIKFFTSFSGSSFTTEQSDFTDILEDLFVWLNVVGDPLLELLVVFPYENNKL